MSDPTTQRERRWALTQLELALGPLAVFAILATTAVPSEIRGEVGWSLRFTLFDLAQNLLLYAPLGAALATRRLRVIMLAAFALSCTIEFTQMWGVGRYASPWDLMANTAGAVFAAWAMRKTTVTQQHSVMCVRIRPSRLIAMLVAATVVLAFWSQPALDAGLDTWDSTYPGWLGNERTADRPWTGRFDAVQLVGRALSAAEVAQLRDARLSPPNAAVHYSLAVPFEVQRAPARRLPDAAVRAFVDDAKATDGFSIIARVTPRDLSLFGPARIVSISTDTLYRNLDLGQDGQQLVLRVRTLVSGSNAQRLRVTTRAVLVEGRSVDVVATYDEGIGRIFVDGRLAARTNFAAAGCASRSLCDSAAAAAWGFLGGMGAVLMLSLIVAEPSRLSPFRRLLVALGGASCAVVCTRGSPVWHIIAGAHGWLPSIAFVAAVVVWFAHARAVRAQRAGRAISRW